MQILRNLRMRACLALIFGAGALILGWSTHSNANVGESYGFGSRTAALAGAGVAWGIDAFAAYHNPAQLALQSQKRLMLNWGLVYMQPKFKSIENVLTQNNYTADAETYGDVDTNYRETFGQELGVSYRLFPDYHNFTVGLVTFLPFNQVAYMDSGEAYVPEYVLYRARMQRPQFDLGVGAEMGKGFHFGLGVHVGFSLSSKASIFINTKNNTTSTMRFTSSMKPKASPFVGLLWAPGDPGDNEKKFSLGGVFRFPMSSDNTMVLSNAARVFGNLAAIDFNFNAFSALYYDPMAIELGGSWQATDAWRFYGQVDYQFWSRYQAPAMQIEQPDVSSTDNAGAKDTVRIVPGVIPNFNYANILVPRVGWELAASEKTTLRMGYAYRPSFLKDLSTDIGNYLDPPKHMLNVGLGIDIDHILAIENKCRLDFNLAYQILLTQHISKSPNNEAGVSGSKIGSPGYDSGGKNYGGGVTLSLAL